VPWTIEYERRVARDIKDLGHQEKKDIVQYLKERIATDEHPCRFGKPLVGDLKGLWRYRVGDYRIICRILEEERIVQVIGIGHRKEVYE
jgi:mRNA interferase RelE/StbE